MGVLWNFMGASMAYTVFAGASEVLGAVLLWFRRTTTLGALVSFGVMANVAALNYCYDVPVKLYSTNLVLMSIFLLTPELRRLTNVLVLNRAVPPADEIAVRFERRGLRIASKVLWIVLGLYVLVSQVTGLRAAYQRLYANPKHSPIYGVYDVASYREGGRELTLASDTSRWRAVVFQDGAMVVRTMDDKIARYFGKYDDSTNSITLNEGVVKWHRDGDDLVVNHKAGEAHLRKADDSRWLLKNRGFHWINEMPLNR